MKIPRIPTDDNAGRAVPKYRDVWSHLSEVLPTRSDSNNDSHPLYGYLEEADGPLKQLAGAWEETFEAWQEAKRDVPPAMIVVCHETAMARLLERHIGELGEASPLLQNTQAEPFNTVRIDSSVLDRAESRLDTTAGDAPEALRRLVATVGSPGEPGEAVRCVISVAMLSEGWSANNVTQILGLRAFQSQLLCEQVIGRGLRRADYSDLTQPEYVDVYGVPFQLLPFAKRNDGVTPEPPKTTLVRTITERQDLRIRFPRVVQIVHDVADELSIDLDAIEPIRVSSQADPTSTWVAFETGDASTGMGGEIQDRERAYANFRIQRLRFRVAGRLVETYNKPWLFPQALNIVERVINERVDYEPGVDPRELCNVRYTTLLVERIAAALRAGEGHSGALLPALDEYEPIGSTDQIAFYTCQTLRSNRKEPHLPRCVRFQA